MTDIASHLSPAELPFATALGELVIEWNETEARIRNFLAGLIHPKPKNAAQAFTGSIMVLELGAVSMEQAIQSFAANVHKGDAARAVNHVAALFSRLRPYRNYYVHGVTSTLLIDGQPRGTIFATTAKGKLVQNRDFVSVGDLRWLIGQCRTLRGYANNVSNSLTFDPNDPWMIDLGRETWPLPEQPPLPPVLTKTARSIAELSQPPTPSQA